MWPASQQGALLVSGCELSSRPSFSRASGLGYRIDRSEPTRRFRGYGTLALGESAQCAGKEQSAMHPIHHISVSSRFHLQTKELTADLLF
jgi:hypothetical protein